MSGSCHHAPGTSPRRDKGIHGDPPTLPQVTGQHRNRALAAARQGPAPSNYEPRGGRTRGIADQFGYAVHNIVGAALRAGTTEAVENLQHLDGERLDALQQALWAEAMEGDLPAVAAIVRIIRARSRQYGLTGKAPMPRRTRKRPDMTDSTQETFSG